VWAVRIVISAEHIYAALLRAWPGTLERAIRRVMERLNLTLDDGTSEALGRVAKKQGKARAGVARELIKVGLQQLEAKERREKLARDYAAGREDAREVLRESEAGQLELLGDEDA